MYVHVYDWYEWKQLRWNERMSKLNYETRLNNQNYLVGSMGIVYIS